MEERFEAIRIYDREDISEFKQRFNKSRLVLEQYRCEPYFYSEFRYALKIHHSLCANSRFKGLADYFAQHCPLHSPSFPHTAEAYCERVDTIIFQSSCRIFVRRRQCNLTLALILEVKACVYHAHLLGSLNLRALHVVSRLRSSDLL